MVGILERAIVNCCSSLQGGCGLQVIKFWPGENTVFFHLHVYLQVSEDVHLQEGLCEHDTPSGDCQRSAILLCYVITLKAFDRGGPQPFQMGAKLPDRTSLTQATNSLKTSSNMQML